MSRNFLQVLRNRYLNKFSFRSFWSFNNQFKDHFHEFDQKSGQLQQADCYFISNSILHVQSTSSCDTKSYIYMLHYMTKSLLTTWQNNSLFWFHYFLNNLYTQFTVNLYNHEEEYYFMHVDLKMPSCSNTDWIK